MKISNIPVQVQQNTAQKGATSFDSLRPGDTLQAEVLSSDSKGVQLKLPDGTQVTAQRASTGSLPQGQELSFTVTSKSGGQLTVALTDPSIANQNLDASKLLRAFGLSNTPQNAALLTEMLSGGTTPTRGNMQSLSQLLTQFPEMTPQQAVFMAREGIPINQQSIGQFQSFLQHQNLVGDQLQNILTLLGDQTASQSALQSPSAPQSTPPAQTPQAMAQGAANPTGAPSEGGAVLPDGPALTQQAAMPEQTQAVTQQATLADGQPAPTNAPELSQAQQVSQTAQQDSLPQQTQTPASPGLPLQEAAQAPQQVAQQPTATAPQTTGSPHAMVGDQAPLAAQQTADTAAALPSAEAAGSEPTAPASQAGAPKAADLPQAQGSASQDRQAAVTQAVSAPFSGRAEDIKELIGSLFRRVDPDHAHTLPRDMNAKTMIAELQEATELLNERLSSMPESSRGPLQQAVRELEQSVRFLNQLNNFTPVVTIPLQWGDNRTTAELYVFNDSPGKKRIDPQNATVFLSLMTSNVGRVETLIKVLGTNVECDFKLELDDTVPLVQAGLPGLSSMLDNQGYRLARTSVQETDKAADLFDVDKVREENKQRYFFNRTV